MKQAIVGLALSVGLVHGENMQLVGKDDGSGVSVELTDPGVQADCTVIKAAYRAAQCDCTNDADPSTMRSLEEKLSISVTVAAEKTGAVISAARMAGSAETEIVASPQTSWNFWMTSSAYWPDNVISLTRIGSFYGRVLYPHGDRYHPDWYGRSLNSDPSLPPLLKPPSEVIYESPFFSGKEHSGAWTHTPTHALGLSSTISGVDETFLNGFFFTRHWPVLYSYGFLSMFMRCDAYGGEFDRQRLMGGNCVTYYVQGDETARVMTHSWMHKQYPYNLVRDNAGYCYKDVTPLPASAQYAERTVTTPSGQTRIFYCEGVACTPEVCASMTNAADYVDITERDVPWSQYPTQARYQQAAAIFASEANVFQNDSAVHGTLDSPTLQDLPADLLALLKS